MTDEQCCRICREVGDDTPLISPCMCKGSMKYVHRQCLLNWLRIQEPSILVTCSVKCDICRQPIDLNCRWVLCFGWDCRPALLFLLQFNLALLAYLATVSVIFIIENTLLKAFEPFIATFLPFTQGPRLGWLQLAACSWVPLFVFQSQPMRALRKHPKLECFVLAAVANNCIQLFQLASSFLLRYWPFGAVTFILLPMVLLNSWLFHKHDVFVMRHILDRIVLTIAEAVDKQYY